MKRFPAIIMVLLAALILAGCAANLPRQKVPPDQRIGRGDVLRYLTVDAATENKILDLNPEKITERDIREVLSKAPAPRILNIHGGIYPVHLAMKSFSIFLISMGYPESSLKNPNDDSFSYSCYENSEKLAGIVAWHYERDGLRPMMVGHSQGGVQTVKVLYELSGSFAREVPVWNPVSDAPEDRTTIIDPISGDERTVVGLKLSFATAVGAGGITLLLPNQWVMINKLRKIPDTVDEFTGFYMGLDLFGGDMLGFSDSNRYEPNGGAMVRNVKLPTGYNHVIVPTTSHLARSQEIRDWINNYTPKEEPVLDVEFESSSTNILWAADVWHSIKKHWALELKRLVKTRQAMKNAR